MVSVTANLHGTDLGTVMRAIESIEEVSDSKLWPAKTRVDVGRDRQVAAQERVRALRETLARQRLGARPEEIQGARARVAAADAQIAVLEKAVTMGAGGVS